MRVPKFSTTGFTLLEILIVLTIMATLTILSSQSIQQAIRSKIKIQSQLDEVSRVRDALRIIERDVNLAFHYRDIEMELFEAIKEARKKKTGNTSSTSSTSSTSTTTTTLDPFEANPNNDPNDPLNSKKEFRKSPVTHFIGTAEEMHFASLNSGRIAEGHPQADFIKVGYSIKDCRRPGQEGFTSKCLLRRSDIFVEGDIKKGGKEVILLEAIEEFKLRYRAFGQTEWVDRWDSLQGDPKTKDKYPDAVEVSLIVSKDDKGKKKRISMQTVIPIRFPNNPDPNQNNNTNSTPKTPGI